MSGSPFPDLDGRVDGLDPADPVAVLNEFYRAFNGRDPEAMARNWMHDGEASMSNPLGGIARGWPAIGAIYARLFTGRARVHVIFHDYTLHALDDAFLAVGRERGTLVAGDTRLDLAIRTSRLYRRVDSGWKQFHHHGSLEDPQLLAAYREAVR